MGIKNTRAIFTLILSFSLFLSCNLFVAEENDPDPEPNTVVPEDNNSDSGIKGLTVNLHGAKAFVTKTASNSRSLNSNGAMSRSLGESPLVKIMEDGSIEDVFEFPSGVQAPDIEFIAVSKDGSIYIQFSNSFWVGDQDMQFIKINTDESIEVIETQGYIGTYNYGDTFNKPIAFADDGGIFYAVDYRDSKGISIKKYLNGEFETIVNGENISIRSFFSDGSDIFLQGSNSSEQNNAVFLRRYRKGSPVLNIFYSKSGNCWIKNVVRHGEDLILNGHGIPDPQNSKITYNGLLKLVKTQENSIGYKWIPVTCDTTDTSNTTSWKKRLNTNLFLNGDGELDKDLLNKVFGRYFVGGKVPGDIDLFSDIEISSQESQNTNERDVFFNKLFSKSSKYIDGSFQGDSYISIEPDNPENYLFSVANELYDTKYCQEYSLAQGLTRTNTNEIIEKIGNHSSFGYYFDSINIKEGITSFPEKVRDYKTIFNEYLDCKFLNKKVVIPDDISYSWDEKGYLIDKRLLNQNGSINQEELYKSFRDNVISFDPQSVKFKSNIDLANFPKKIGEDPVSIIENCLTLTPNKYYGNYMYYGHWFQVMSTRGIVSEYLNSDGSVKTEEVLTLLKKFESDSENPFNYFDSISLKGGLNLALFPKVITDSGFKGFLKDYFDLEWGDKPVMSFDMNKFFNQQSSNGKYIFSELNYERWFDSAFDLLVKDLTEDTEAGELLQKSNNSKTIDIDSEFSKEELFNKIVWEFEENDPSQTYNYKGVLGEFRVIDSKDDVSNFITNFFYITHNEWHYENIGSSVFEAITNSIYTEYIYSNKPYYFSGNQDLQNFIDNILDGSYIKAIKPKNSNGSEVSLWNVFSYDEVYNQIEWEFENKSGNITYDKMGSLGAYRVVATYNDDSNFITNFFDVEFSDETMSHLISMLKYRISENIFNRTYYPFKHRAIEQIIDIVKKGNASIKNLNIEVKSNNGKSLEISDYVSDIEKNYKVFWQFEEKDPSKEYPYDGILGKYRYDNTSSSPHFFFENFFTYTSEPYGLDDLYWEAQEMIVGSYAPYNNVLHKDVFYLRDRYINEDKTVNQNLIDNTLKDFYIDPATVPKAEAEIDMKRFLDPASHQGSWVNLARIKFGITSQGIENIPSAILRNDYYEMTEDFYNRNDYYNLERFTVSDNGDITGLFKTDSGDYQQWNVIKILEGNSAVRKPILENIETNMLKLYNDIVFYTNVSSDGIYSLKSMNLLNNQSVELLSYSHNLELYNFDAALSMNKLFYTAYSYNDNSVKLGTVDLLTNEISYTDKKKGINKGSEITVYSQE